MSMAQSIQEAIEAFNLDTDLAIDQELPEVQDHVGQESGIRTQTVEKTIVRPYNPVEGDYEDEEYKFLFEDGNQLVLTISHRPECPSCGYMASDPDKPHNLQGECGGCRTQTCPACTKTCDACGKILCDDCTNGDSLHYVEYETLCTDCIAAVKEEVRYRRATELQELHHADQQEQREQTLSEREHLFEEQWKKKKLRHQFLETVLDHRESEAEQKKTGSESPNQDRSAFRRNAVTTRQQLR